MATKQELDTVASESKTDLGKAQKAFEDLRKNGSAEDLVKAAHTVTTATRSYGKAQTEADTFELVAVYETIRAAILSLTPKAFDMATMARHNVAAVTITVPVGDGPVESDKLVVNTLGKRTVVKGAGDGSRTRYVYGPDKLNSRQVVEAEGAAEVGAEKAEATLAEPSKFGLTHLADRIAGKLGWDKVPA